MRRYVVIGQRATASPEFSLIDIPGTSGRLDVLLRCVRAALLVSHGLRRDSVVYLVLGGGPDAPRSVRIDGATAKYVRPDDRSLAVAIQKTLRVTPEGPGFEDARPGIAIARGGLEAVLADLGPGTMYVLDEGGPDVRDGALDLDDPIFFVGDHLGFDEATRARIAELGAETRGVGPVSLHAEDAIVLVSNELDRRRPPAPATPPRSPPPGASGQPAGREQEGVEPLSRSGSSSKERWWKAWSR